MLYLDEESLGGGGMKDCRFQLDRSDCQCCKFKLDHITFKPIDPVKRQQAYENEANKQK